MPERVLFCCLVGWFRWEIACQRSTIYVFVRKLSVLLHSHCHSRLFKGVLSNDM